MIVAKSEQGLTSQSFDLGLKAHGRPGYMDRAIVTPVTVRFTVVGRLLSHQQVAALRRPWSNTTLCVDPRIESTMAASSGARH